MNPNPIPKRLKSWAFSLAAIFIAVAAFGHIIVQTGPPSTQAGGAITINDNANASPYPSEVLVTNYIGHITRVEVTLNGVAHGYPDDIDVVLVGPDNTTKVVLMSDAGGQFDIGGVDLTFSSAAPTAAALPDESPIASGRFRPTNHNTTSGDIDPAIAAGAGTDLGVFIGQDPNGLWRLYVNDDTVVDSGSIRSWTLRIFTEPIVTVSTNRVVTAEDTSGSLTVTVNDSDTPASGLSFSATIPNDSTNLIQSVTFADPGTGTNRIVTVTPRANQTGTGTFNIVVGDGTTNKTTTITVEVTPVNDAPTIALNTPTTQVAQGGISTNILANLSDVDNDPATLEVLAVASSDSSVVPISNVFVVGSGTNNAVRHIRVSPAANAASGSATLTIRVRDAAGATNNASLTVTVVPVSHVVAGNPGAITIPTGGTATPYPSTVTVQNVSGLVGEVTVTLLDFNHAEPNDAGLLLVGPQGQAVVLMRGAGGTTPVSDLRLVFDDDNGPIPAGAITAPTNAPADYGSGNFPATAPAAPYTTTLDSFVGTNPNGTWSLYVYDQEANAAGGAINGGWAVNIFPAPVVGPIAPQSTPEDTPRDVVFSVTDQDGTVTNVFAQVVTTGNTPMQIVNVSSNLSGTTATLRLTPIANLSGTNLIRVIAQDNMGFTGTNIFSLVVTPVNDLPTMSVIPKQLARAGESVGPISFTVADVETPPGNLEVRVTSNNPKLLPPGSLVLGGSGSTRTLTIFPSGAAGGQADITVTVIDANGGSTSQTFDLTVEEAAFPLYENANGIVINDSGNPATSAAASPYPSIISVTNLTSPIAEVRVTLFGITHPKPDDIDVMLVHPNGVDTLKLMSDVGGGSDKPINNVTLIFQDSAPGPIGDETQIVSGAYDPSDVGGGDFPFGGSPAESTDTSFSAAFNGLAPNGDWRLYVVDDSGDLRGGVITSWQLGIRTRPVLAAIPDQTTTEDTPLRFTVDVGDAQPGVEYTITTNVTPLAGSPNVVDAMDIDRSGDTLVITITPEPDLSGTNLISITVTDPDGNSTSRSFNFIVTPRNDAPRFSDIPNTNTPAATPITIAFTVVDVEGSAVTVTATSSDQSVVPNGNIVVSPSGGTTTARTVTITPAGIAFGSTTITLTGNDGTTTSTETFVLEVRDNVSFENTRNIVINDFAPATPYPSTIDVAGVVGSVSDVRVILQGFAHQYPDDVDVLLVSPDNRRIMLMSDAGGSTAVSNRRLTFSSDAAGTIPDEGPLPSGVFLPSNYTDVGEGADVMPSPAPSGPYSTDLNSLDGVNPNGQWRLFVRDDTFQLSGEITGGWILILETGPTITSIPAQTTAEDVPLPIRFTIADQDTPASNLVVTATVTGNSVPNLVSNTPVGLVLSGTGETRTLTVVPSPNLSGTNLITVTVTDGDTSASTAFPFRVTPVDDPPVFTSFEGNTNRYVMAEEATRTITFTISDIDSTVGRTNITVATSNPTLLTNIVVGGEVNDAGDDEAVETLTVTPNANQTGTAVLTISLRDQTTTVTTNITIEVTPVNDIPTIQVSTNFVSVVAGQTSGIVNVRITDIETLPRNLVLTANSLNPSIIPTANVLLGGADTNRTAQFVAVSQPGTAVVQLIVSDGTDTNIVNVTVEVRPAPGSVFANPAAITIRDNNTASPYPSTIIVSGMRGPITRVSVTLDGLTHNAPDDVDILLVHGPSGRRSIITSDAGGRTPVSNVRLTFDELNATRDLPDESPITPGTYSATDYAPADTFTGAPAGANTANLANFNGVGANGDWSLYVVDDTAGDAGQIAFGWSLRIETAPTVVATPTQQTTNEDVAQVFDVTIDDMTTTNALSLSFANSNPGIIQSVTFTPNPITSPDLDVTVRPVPNASGTNILTITVRNPSGATGSTTVTNIFVPIADPPTMSRVVNQTTQEDRPVSFELLVNDVDTPLSGLWLEGVSGNQAVISSTNILINGTTNFSKGLPDNIVRITLQPNAGAVGTSLITLNLSEGGTNNLVSSNFTLTVTERNDAPVIVNTNTTVAIPAGETGNITVQASDPEGLATTLTATSSDQALVRNADIVISPVTSTTAARSISITTQPGVTGRTTITLVASDPANNRTTNTFSVDVRPTRERVFSNRSLITINDNASATPYPSVINVSGLVGSIAKVTVTINRFYHTFPDDVDMLLVSPTGQKVLIWADAGGDTDVTNIVIKLDDAALNALPDSTPLTSGTFRPFNDANDTTSDVFDAPAPAAPYAGTLATFNGQNANGNWSLYVRDDTASDSGLIVEGWSLGITTQPILVGLNNVTSPEDRAVTVNFTVAEESFASTDFTFTGTSSNPAVVPNSTNNIVFGGSGTNRSVTIIPAQNASGSSTITVRLRNIDGQEVTGSFVATFTPVNDVPTITQLGPQTVPAGGEITITNFNYTDVETERSLLVLSVASSNPDVIPTNNVVIVGDEVRIIANGDATGRSIVTITVTDQGGASASTTFEVTVVAGANPIFANTDGIVIRDNNTALPYPSTIVVSGVSGLITDVNVTLAQIRHVYPDDVDILLVGPGGQSIVLMSDAGAGGDNTPAELENARFTYDDSGALPADNAALPETATFRPSNFEGTDDAFPAPAPGGTRATALSVFNGTNPNGTWSLYVMDDASPDSGSIGSWFLTFATTAPSITQVPSPVVLNENTPTNFTVQVSAPGVDSSNIVVRATIEGTPIISVAVTGTGPDRTVTITPRTDQIGTNVVTLTAADQTGTTTNTASTTFTVIVRNVDNDPPTIGPVADQRVDSGETLVVTIPFSDVDTPADDLSFSAGSSGNGTNIVDDIRLDRGTNANTLVATITTIPGRFGTEIVTIQVFDGDSLVRTSFELTAESDNRPPIIEPIANVDTAEDVSPTVRINVSDPETPLSQLTITGQASNTNLVRSVNIANNGTNVQATINLVPNASGTSTITISANDGTNTTTATFTLRVFDVVECPVLGPIANQNATPGTTTVRVPLNVTDADNALNDPAIQFQGGAGGTAIVQSIAFERTATSVTAVLTLQSGASGSDTVTIRVLEGECIPSAQSFTLTVGGQPTPASLAIARSGTNIVLTVTGQAGATYAIEATSDFRSWTEIGTVTIEPDGNSAVTIPANQPFRFFRVRGGAAPAPAPAAVYEGYGYPAGTLIGTNTNGGIGWAGAWIPDAETPTNHVVMANSLEYADAAGRGLITTPGSVFYTATTNNMASGDVRSFRTFAAGVQSTGTTWVSFIAQRMGPTITNTGTPNNIYPRAANISFYEGGSERFAIGNGSGAVSNLWSILPAGSVANVTNDQRSAVPMNQQSLIVLRIDHNTSGTNDSLYMWVNPSLGAEPGIATASARSVNAFNFSIDRIRPFVGGADTANNRPHAELSFDEFRLGNTFASVTPFVSDVTQPFNPVVLVNGTNDGDTAAGAPPANEGVERVTDNAGQKYLNFLDLDSGFIVTPLGSTVVNGLRFWPANDAPDRDPASYRLEGSTAGASGPWTLISEGPLSLPLARNPGGATTPLQGGIQQVVRFTNASPYTSYRVTFPTLRNATGANSMQIAEVDFLSF